MRAFIILVLLLLAGVACTDEYMLSDGDYKEFQQFIVSDQKYFTTEVTTRDIEEKMKGYFIALESTDIDYDVSVECISETCWRYLILIKKLD